MKDSISTPCRKFRTRNLILTVAILPVLITVYFVTVKTGHSPVGHNDTRGGQNHNLTDDGRNRRKENIFLERIVSRQEFSKPSSKKMDPSRGRQTESSGKHKNQPASPPVPQYVYIKGSKSKHFDSPSERKRFCPPLPLRFPSNASFFPCDWDVKRVICRSRLKANLVCNETSSAIMFGQVPLGTPPYRVPFHDTCLDRVIRTHCHDDEFRVPRVLHYVTVNKQKFPFFWFLSVLSAVRYLQPCLVLFHGDYLPFGAHWEALLQLVPHVVHVARDQPTSIFGHRIDDIHHRTDVIRLEAVISNVLIYIYIYIFSCSGPVVRFC